jgi:hypothetical protein
MAFSNNGKYNGKKYVERKISDSQTKLLVDTHLCSIFGNAYKQKEEGKKNAGKLETEDTVFNQETVYY